MSQERDLQNIVPFEFDPQSRESRAVQLSQAILDEPEWTGVNPGTRWAQMVQVGAYTIAAICHIVTDDGRPILSPEQNLGFNRDAFEFAMKRRFAKAFRELTTAELTEMWRVFADPIDPIGDWRDPSVPLPRPYTPPSWAFTELNRLCIERALADSNG